MKNTILSILSSGAIALAGCISPAPRENYYNGQIGAEDVFMTQNGATGSTFVRVCYTNISENIIYNRSFFDLDGDGRVDYFTENINGIERIYFKSKFFKNMPPEKRKRTFENKVKISKSQSEFKNYIKKIKEESKERDRIWNAKFDF